MLRHQTSPTTIPYRTVASSAGPTSGIPVSEKGVPGGIAPLDNEGKLAASRTRISAEAAARLVALEAAPAEGLTRVGNELRLAIHTLPTG